MDEPLLVIIVVAIVAGILVLALLKKDTVKATLRFLGLEFNIETTGKPDTVAGHRGAEAEKAIIKAVVLQHNRDFASAVNHDDPRYLGPSSTPDAYHSQLMSTHRQVVDGLRAQGIRGLEVSDISYLSIELLDRDTAQVTTLETWVQTTADDRAATTRSANAYVLKKKEGIWLIHRAESRPA